MRGTGIDIIEIGRIRNSIDRYKNHFLNKIFTPKEQEYCKRYRDATPHLAGRFAAKEAVAKALGTGISAGLSFLDIEIESDPKGKPQIILSEASQKLFGNPQFLLSITHCREYAAAIAILL